MPSFKQALAAFLVASCYATTVLAYTPEFNDVRRALIVTGSGIGG